MLGDIQFSDIYLGEGASWLSGIPGTLDPVPAPAHTLDELKRLRALCEEQVKQSKRGEFAIRMDGTAYRASIIHSMNEEVFVLRRFPEKVPDIETLNLHPGVIQKLMEPGMTGLVVVSGAYGQGKTTTVSSLIKARLSKFGGVAVTIEDPPEMPLEGRHGEGVCYQTWVEQGGFGQACRQAARWAPSIIFLGEVRDDESASEALRASINGRLVICTTHADNVVATVERLYSLSNGVAGNSEDVASLLSQGLTAIINQKLTGEKEKRPKLEFLFLKGDDEAYKGASNMIRMRRFEQLGSEITLQANRMLSSFRSAA